MGFTKINVVDSITITMSEAPDLEGRTFKSFAEFNDAIRDLSATMPNLGRACFKTWFRLVARADDGEAVYEGRIDVMSSAVEARAILFSLAKHILDHTSYVRTAPGISEEARKEVQHWYEFARIADQARSEIEGEPCKVVA